MLREVFAKLKDKHGTVAMVVDQPASIGALSLAVARGVAARPDDAAYRRPLPREAKTDARGAFVITDAARVMPHTRWGGRRSWQGAASLQAGRRDHDQFGSHRHSRGLQEATRSA